MFFYFFYEKEGFTSFGPSEEIDITLICKNLNLIKLAIQMK